jgi:integrase/recombinase XerD
MLDISFSKAVRGFHVSNEAEGLSPKTIRWYDNNLQYFRVWARKKYTREPKLQEITAEDIREYLTDLRGSEESYANHPFTPKQNRKISPRTIQGYYSSLSAFFNWALREEFIEKSPVKNVPRPRVPKYLPDPFTDEEVKKLLRAAKQLDDRMALRMTAILMVMLDTGLRLTELLEMKKKDLDLDQSRALIMGKGAKQRYIFFGKTSRKALWQYISMARPEPKLGIDNVFLTHDGRRMKQRRFAQMLKDLGAKAGVENVHPHRFRRYATISCLRAGMGELFLSKMLGHEDTSLLKVYAAVLPDDVQRAHIRVSPMDGLKE